MTMTVMSGRLSRRSLLRITATRNWSLLAAIARSAHLNNQILEPFGMNGQGQESFKI